MKNKYRNSKSESCVVTHRSVVSGGTRFKTDTGEIINARRFLPLGKNDEVRVEGSRFEVFARHEQQWIRLDRPWRAKTKLNIGDREIDVETKEIETAEELDQFEELRAFHYRGSGGAGRVVPIIATTKVWDLPPTLGFIEISSSMIANSARRSFFDGRYSDGSGVSWSTWDRTASKAFSNTICRISRFVIHPEIRGLGIAKPLLKAAREYAGSQWHYGGFRPRFMEITADMLTYYPFVDRDFVFMGKTEGNAHRLSKDMNYLVRKALSPEGEKAMPQGGGGVMSMQRGYAVALVKHLQDGSRSLNDIIKSLRYESSSLDQETWEALYRLNRQPKPCYIAGLSQSAKKYVLDRYVALGKPSTNRKSMDIQREGSVEFTGLTVDARTPMAQTTRARTIQDAFGFVGRELEAEIIKPLDVKVPFGAITLICGASGSGKTLLIEAMKQSLSGGPASIRNGHVKLAGTASGHPQLKTLPELDDQKCPLDYIDEYSVDGFISVAASCGLAEPQLFVRPISGLSSGQKYRLQLALTMLSKPEVVFIDNFCEALDQYTTLAVCKGLRKLAESSGSAVVVATAAYERLLPLLQHDQSILLRRGSHPLIDYSESQESG